MSVWSYFIYFTCTCKYVYTFCNKQYFKILFNLCSLQDTPGYYKFRNKIRIKEKT